MPVVKAEVPQREATPEARERLAIDRNPWSLYWPDEALDSEPWDRNFPHPDRREPAGHRSRTLSPGQRQRVLQLLPSDAAGAVIISRRLYSRRTTVVGIGAVLARSRGKYRYLVPDSGLSVPLAFRAGFQTIARLTDDQAASTLDALTRATDSLTAARLAEHITREVPSLGREDADAIVAAVLSIIAARRQIWTDVTSVELARDVAGSSDLELPSNQQEAFADRLAQLMDAEALRIAIKAQDIRTEHPQVFRRARVFTDMRPVFKDDVSEPPAGAVILETLKIEYFTEGLEPAAFYVMLDQDDLRSLQEVIERALDKTESLKRVLASSSIAVGEFSDAPRAEESK